MNQVEVKRRKIQAFSNILALIGLLFLEIILEYNGTAYLGAACACFIFVWILTGKYASETIVKMIKGRNNKAQYRSTGRVRKNLMLVSFVTGIAGALVLGIGGSLCIYNAFNLHNAAVLALALAPAIIFGNINSTILGFFQSEGTELPTSAASVLRVIFTIGFSFLFGIILRNYGIKVSTLLLQNDFTGMYAALGTASAISVAEIFIFLFLTVLYKASSHSAGVSGRQVEGSFTDESFSGVFAALYSNMAGIMFIMILIILPFVIGILLYMRSLGTDISGMADMTGTAEYGIYFGKYLAVMGIMIFLLDMSVVQQSARVFNLYKKGEAKPFRACFQDGLHMFVVFGAFISVIFMALPSQIADILCKNNSETASLMIQSGSFVILFIVLSDYIVRVLYMAERQPAVYASLGVMDIVFIASVCVMLNMTDSGLMSLVYGGLAAAAVLCVVLVICFIKIFDIKADAVKLLCIPAGCACVSGLAAFLLGKLLTPNLGSIAAVIISVVLSFVIYSILLLVFRNLREQELKLVPAGGLMRMLGQALHLL
jgi:hypothetical protein